MTDPDLEPQLQPPAPSSMPELYVPNINQQRHTNKNNPTPKEQLWAGLLAAMFRPGLAEPSEIGPGSAQDPPAPTEPTLTSDEIHSHSWVEARFSKTLEGEKECKRVFRELSKELHPDLGNLPKGLSKKQAKIAFEHLCLLYDPRSES